MHDVTICSLEQTQGHISWLLLTLTALVTAIADQLAKVARDLPNSDVVTVVADIINKWIQEAKERDEKFTNKIHSQSKCLDMVS